MPIQYNGPQDCELVIIVMQKMSARAEPTGADEVE